MRFKAKVVLVTGGSSGIGAATAIQFAKESAKVAIVGRNIDKLESVADICQKHGERPLVIIADLTRDEELKTIVEKTVNRYGKLDILINNAGILSFNNTIHDHNLMEVYDRIMANNLRHVFHITHLAVPELIKTKGNIVNVSSIFGSAAVSTEIAYATSKAAMDHFTHCLALELAKHGVRVNSVNPGPVITDIILNLGMNEQINKMALDRMGQITPLKGVSESKEIADLILYLASDLAQSITGGLYPIDRGTLLVGCASLCK